MSLFHGEDNINRYICAGVTHPIFLTELMSTIRMHSLSNLKKLLVEIILCAVDQTTEVEAPLRYAETSLYQHF